jgi:hypothetical protein
MVQEKLHYTYQIPNSLQGAGLKEFAFIQGCKDAIVSITKDKYVSRPSLQEAQGDGISPLMNCYLWGLAVIEQKYCKNPVLRDVKPSGLDYAPVKDLSALVNGMRRNPGFIPDWAWENYEAD